MFFQDENVAEGTESLSKEELGRLVASRWTGGKTDQHKEEIDASQDKDHQYPNETPNAANDDEDTGYISDGDDPRYDDDDVDNDDQADDFEGVDHYDSSSSQRHESDDDLDDLSGKSFVKNHFQPAEKMLPVYDLKFSDITGTSGSSWLEKIQKRVKTIFQAVNIFQKPVNVSGKDNFPIFSITASKSEDIHLFPYGVCRGCTSA